MKTLKKLFSLLLVLCLLFSITGNAFAVSYTGNTVVPGLSGIQPSDKLTLPDDTISASLTAVWGVRVNFYDSEQFNHTLINSTLVEEGKSAGAPTAPTHSGFVFAGWTRTDTHANTATLNGGIVHVGTGAGPVDYVANYRCNLTDGTITVINATHGYRYEGYKIFDASISPDNTDAIIYTISETSPWYDFVKDYFTLTEMREDGDGNMIYSAEAKEGFDPKTFFENLPTDGIEPDLETKNPERDGVIFWDEVSFGYYAITSSLGSWVTVNTNNPFVTVIDKNQSANLDKNIVTASGDTKSSSASFGESVSFDIDLFASDFKANELVTYYHITDTIGDGFDYDFTADSNLTVKVTGTQLPAYEYTLSPVSSLNALKAAKSGYYFTHTAGSRTFELTVKWATLDAAGKLMPVYTDEFNHIHVTYSATLNSDAVIAGSGNLNTARFTYDKTSGFDPENPPTEEPTPGENPEDPNTPVTTTTYVYALGIEKVDAEDPTRHLPGVKFTTTEFRAKDLGGGVYEVIGADDTTSAAVGYFEVPENGYIVIKGLGAGEHTFTETETLPGYNLLAEPLVITIPASGETADTIAETPCAAICTVENSSGAELPATGGMGTGLFFIGGSMLVLAAGIMLVTNWCMKKEIPE